ncbi:hypothetical protein [Klebsiella phage vB_KpnM_TU02]|nr:hypothetical protein [Klebsiella phage vB_KpnM_TU02]
MLPEPSISEVWRNLWNVSKILRRLPRRPRTSS